MHTLTRLGLALAALGATALMPATAETIKPAAAPKTWADPIPSVAPSRSHTGCFIRLHGGAAAMDTQAGLSTAPPGSVSIIELDGIAASGGIIGAGFGCDVQLGKSGFVLGAFTDYSKHSGSDWHLRIAPATTNVDFTTGLDSEFTVGVRAGYLLTPKTLVYVLGGWSQLELNSFSGSVGGVAMPGALSFAKFDGWQYGVGMESMLAGGWVLGLEYRGGIYDSQSLPIAPGAPVNLVVEPTTHSARLSLSYKFGLGSQ